MIGRVESGHGWREQAGVCLAVGLFAPAVDLLANDEGQVVVGNLDRLPYPGALWFALAVICAAAVLASFVLTGAVRVVARDPEPRKRGMWVAGMLAAAGFAVLSIGTPWYPFERSHKVLMAGSLGLLTVVVAVPLLRRVLARYAEPLMNAAPAAATGALCAHIAVNTFVPGLGLMLRTIGIGMVFAAVFLAGLSIWRRVRNFELHGALVAVLLCGLSWPLWNEPPSVAPAPLELSEKKVQHIVFVVIDTLRRDGVSAFGGKVTTPRLDDLASQSVMFTNAYSTAPWTLPAVISMMTGVHPFVHDAVRIGRLLPPELPTMAEILSERGYATHSIGFNPLLAELRGPGTGVQRGFPDARFAPGPQGPYTLVTRWMYEPFHEELATYFTTQEIGEMASEWIDSNYESDFFLWVHFYDPHMPFHPLPEDVEEVHEGPSPVNSLDYEDIVKNPEAIAKRSDMVRDLYDAEILGVDDALGDIVDTLQQREIFDDSLIVVVSDHGTEIYERGRIEHGNALYWELLDVPLFFKLPGDGAQTVVEERVSTADVFSTVMELTGAKYDATLRTTQSLVPYWSTDVEKPLPRTFVSTAIVEGPAQDAAIFDDYKYIRRRTDGREELYDVRRDPREANNIVDRHPQLAKRGRSLIEEKQAQAEELRELWGLDRRHEQRFDRMGFHILRTLGYLN